MNRIEGNHFNNYSYHVVYESTQRNLKPKVRTTLTLELNLATLAYRRNAINPLISTSLQQILHTFPADKRTVIALLVPLKFER